MTRLLTLALFAIAMLCACGGGGSVASPATSAPTLTPYAAKLVFVGPLNGTAAIAARTRGLTLRRILDSGTGTPPPVMVISPMNADGTIDGIAASVFGGVVEAVVSPAATGSPQTTFSNTNGAVALATIAPTSFPTNIVAEENATTSGTPNAQASGLVTAAIGAPVNQSPATQVYAYQAISVSCENPLPERSSPGWAYANGAWSAVSSPAQADVYLTGPKCPGAFFATTPDATFAVLNFPGGGATLSTDTAFCSIAASQWQDAEASADMETIDTLNADGSQNTELLAKTRDGSHLFKLFPNSFGPYPGDISGAIEVSGSSVDGF
jgi:hypothetical protein